MRTSARAIGLLIASACGACGDEPAPRPPAPATTTARARDAGVDAGPAAARLPERCVRYKTTVAALGTCAALSRDDRDSMMRTYLHMENLWATAASNSLVGLGPGCEMARRDLVSLEARCGRAPGAAERDLPLD